MQALLNQLSPEIAIAIIVVGFLFLIGVVFLARRRRRAPAEDGGQTDVVSPIDYTAIPLDEGPQSFRDRFNNLSLAGKLLAVLAPILLILFLVVLVLTLGSGGQQTAGPLPTPVPVQLSFSSEPTVIRVDPSQVIGFRVTTTGIPAGTELAVEMREDGQPFPWINPELARATVLSSGAADVQVPRAENAPRPSEGRAYTLVVTGPDGVSQEAPIIVPQLFANAFFGAGAVAEATVEATVEPTAEATVEPTAEVTVEPTVEATPTAELPTGVPAGVRNGGNVRALPFLAAENRVGGVNAGDQVQLVQRTPNGAWYRVRFTNADDGAERLGWISASLLTVEPTAAAGVPVAPVVSVFEAGPVYEQPDLSSTQIDRINGSQADIPGSEVVELLRKSADGTWYEVRNVRDITGWVPAASLGIPPELGDEVPVAQ